VTFALVHGAWHGAWAWDALIPELEARGHRVVAPDLPCEDVDAGTAEYAGVVIEALDGSDDAIVVGHSLGGMTIPLVPARRRSVRDSPTPRFATSSSAPTGQTRPPPPTTCSIQPRAQP